MVRGTLSLSLPQCSPACLSANDCPALDVACLSCPGGTTVCPQTECVRGTCLTRLGTRHVSAHSRIFLDNVASSSPIPRSATPNSGHCRSGRSCCNSAPRSCSPGSVRTRTRRDCRNRNRGRHSRSHRWSCRRRQIRCTSSPGGRAGGYSVPCRTREWRRHTVRASSFPENRTRRSSPFRRRRSRDRGRRIRNDRARRRRKPRLRIASSAEGDRRWRCRRVRWLPDSLLPRSRSRSDRRPVPPRKRSRSRAPHNRNRRPRRRRARPSNPSPVETCSSYCRSPRSCPGKGSPRSPDRRRHSSLPSRPRNPDRECHSRSHTFGRPRTRGSSIATRAESGSRPPSRDRFCPDTRDRCSSVDRRTPRTPRGSTRDSPCR
jgi:hypothetical protein